MVSKWVKEGDPKVLAENHGKCLMLQTFVNPETGEKKDYSLFYGRGKSAIVLALTKDRLVIATKEFRFGSNKVQIQLPGGNAEGNEDILANAARELFEETGWKAGRLMRLSDRLFGDSASLDGANYPVLALDCEWAGNQDLDQTESIEVELFPFDRWLEMIKSGEIDDANTISITRLAEFYI